MDPVFKIRATRDLLGRKRWRFNLVAPNGESVATSESYNTYGAALNGVEAVREYAITAGLEPPERI